MTDGDREHVIAEQRAEITRLREVVANLERHPTISPDPISALTASIDRLSANYDTRLGTVEQEMQHTRATVMDLPNVVGPCVREAVRLAVAEALIDVVTRVDRLESLCDDCPRRKLSERTVAMAAGSNRDGG